MAKFAVGEKVDKAADDHEGGTVAPCSQQMTVTLDTRWTWKGMARSSFSPRKSWSFTPTRLRDACAFPSARASPIAPTHWSAVSYPPVI
jgi:hypothetical protein